MRTILLTLTILLCSCASQKAGKTISNSEFINLINENKCEEALDQFPYRINGQQTQLSIKKGAGIFLSVVATASMTLTLDAIVVLVTCSRHGCFLPEDKYFAMTKDTWKISKPLRCPKLGLLSKSMMQVSRCYADRLDSKSLTEAKEILDYIVENKKYYSCIRHKYKNKIKDEYARIESLFESKKLK